MARVQRWAWQSGTLRVQVTPACRQTFTPWSDLSFLSAGVPLEQVYRHAVHRCLRQGLGGHVQQSCSVGGLDGSPTALAHQMPRVAGSTPGLEPSQETYWSVQTALRPSRTSTDKAVYAPVASLGTILAHPDLIPRADAPRDSPSLADSSEEGSTASETGHPVAPSSRPLETSCLKRRF